VLQLGLQLGLQLVLQLVLQLGLRRVRVRFSRLSSTISCFKLSRLGLKLGLWLRLVFFVGIFKIIMVLDVFELFVILELSVGFFIPGLIYSININRFLTDILLLSFSFYLSLSTSLSLSFSIYLSLSLSLSLSLPVIDVESAAPWLLTIDYYTEELKALISHLGELELGLGLGLVSNLVFGL
jgi:hypothetical protein